VQSTVETYDENGLCVADSVLSVASVEDYSRREVYVGFFRKRMEQSAVAGSYVLHMRIGVALYGVGLLGNELLNSCEPVRRARRMRSWRGEGVRSSLVQEQTRHSSSRCIIQLIHRLPDFSVRYAVRRPQSVKRCGDDGGCL
jgi:hypothetical protein